MTDIQTRDVWQFLELPNRHAKETQALYEWGLNCNQDSNPFIVMLDLIGWTAENYGEHFVLPRFGSLGFMELDYLADALREYANNPHDVTAWIDALMQCEGV